MTTHKESYKVPDGYYYSKDHEWTKQSPNGVVLIGITDYAAKMLHDIVYVTLSKVGQNLAKGEVFGQVESVKTVSDVYSPISGNVSKSNDRLTKEPEIVSSSPYEDGWMLEIKASNYEADVKSLMAADSYRKYIEDLAEKEPE